MRSRADAKLNARASRSFDCSALRYMLQELRRIELVHIVRLLERMCMDDTTRLAFHSVLQADMQNHFSLSCS